MKPKSTRMEQNDQEGEGVKKKPVKRKHDNQNKPNCIIRNPKGQGTILVYRHPACLDV